MILQRPLIHYIDRKRMSSDALQDLHELLVKYGDDYLSYDDKHYPVQIDSNTYKQLRFLKKHYGSYYYESIQDALLILRSLLRKRGAVR